MCEQFVRAGMAGPICRLMAGCSVIQQLADQSSTNADGKNSSSFGLQSAENKGSLSSESKRLMQLAGEVESRGDYHTAAALYERAAQGSGDVEVQLRLGNASL